MKRNAAEAPAPADEAGPSRAEVRAVDPSQADAWDDFVDRHPDATGYHRWGWLEILSGAMRLRVHALGAWHGREIVGVLPLARQRPWPFAASLLSVPFASYAGVVADERAIEESLLSAAVELARAEGIARIELRNQRPRATAWGRREDKVRFTLDVSEGEESLWRRVPSARRRQVRQARRAGLEANVGGIEHLDAFYRIVSGKWRDHGTPILPRHFFAAVMERFPDDTRICLVRSGSHIAAAGFLYRHGECVENPWLGSRQEFAGSRAGILLYWTMMVEAIRWGCATFDMGRSSRDEGPYAFKKQWNAVEEPLVWSIWPPDAVLGAESGRAAAALRSVWRHMPLAIADRVGPPLSRNLPL